MENCTVYDKTYLHCAKCEKNLINFNYKYCKKGIEDCSVNTLDDNEKVICKKCDEKFHLQ